MDQKLSPVDDHEIAEVLVEWRRKMLNQIYKASIFFGFIGLMIMWVTDALPNPEMRPILVLYTIIYLLFITMYFRKDLNQRLRGWLFLWSFYILAVAGMARGGLAGDGRLFLLSLPVLATILVSVNAAAVMAAVSMSTLVVFAWLAGSGRLDSWIFEGLQINDPSLTIWLSEIVYTFIIMGMLLVMLHQFYRFLLDRIAVERRTNHEVNQARTLLQQYNQSLEQMVALRTSELAVAVEEAQEARASAESASSIKSDFLATMSHEIRTPLNSILGMTSLLLDTPLTLKQAEFTETIRGSSEQLLSLINDILDFSKIEAERMELEQTPFLLRQCIQNTIDLISPRAREKKIELLVHIEANTPRAIIGDETRLRQIIVNLLGNAVKFTEAGQVEIFVRAEPLETKEHNPGDLQNSRRYRFVFSIRDTGIGISPEKMQRLFQPFSQGDASTTRRYGGTGLGLVISKRLIEMMHGRIWAESQEGVGTTFTFSIEVDTSNNLAVQTRAEAPFDLRDKIILIIEDNATKRRILTLQLQAWNMNPRATGSISEALHWIAQGERLDAAIINYDSLIGVSTDANKLLKDLYSGTALPIILLISSEFEAPEPEIQTLLAAQLEKPFKASTLYNALINIFGSEIEEILQNPDISPQFDPQMGVRNPLRILIVEDNDINQHLMLLLLERMGYRADIAANGIEALQALQRQFYDAVLMDVQMPEMDGLEATRRIRQEFSSSDQPRIIAMTANAMRGDREVCLAAGMDDYISKPIRIESLVSCLNRCPSRDVREHHRSGANQFAAPEAGSSALLEDGVPLLDMVELLKLQENLGDKSELMLPPLLASFYRQAERLITELRQALAASRLEDLRRVAHTLKSNAATFGARRLEAVARKLEDDARQENTARARDLIDLAEAEYRRARAALQEAQAEISRDMIDKPGL